LLMKFIGFVDVLVAVASLNLKVPFRFNKHNNNFARASRFFVQISLPCHSLSYGRILVYSFCLISIGLSLSDELKLIK